MSLSGAELRLADGQQKSCLFKERMMSANGDWPENQEVIKTELALLDEWHQLQQHLLTFPLSTPSSPALSWRSALETLLRESTQERAAIQWEHSADSLPGAFDRWLEIRWETQRYGLLGLAPGYLRSTIRPTIPERFAQLCGLVLALVEYQTLVYYQLQQLPPAPVIEPLTPREREILLSLVHGESEFEAAQRLGITQATVHSHRQHLYQRLGVHSQHQAVLRAFALRLIDWLDVPGLENNHAPDSAAALESRSRARRGK